MNDYDKIETFEHPVEIINNGIEDQISELDELALEKKLKDMIKSIQANQILE
jgi:hypothetical protein